MKTIYYFFFVLFIAFLSGSCQNNQKAIVEKKFRIDNPTANTISLQIDNSTYQLPANSGKDVMLKYGSHTLTYNNQSVKFVAIPCDEDVILNPTLSNYVFYYELFKIRGKEINMKEVNRMAPAYLFPFTLASGEVVKVPFKLVNSLFIERYEYNWNLGLGEQLRNGLTVAGITTEMTTVIRSKIFREKEFFTYMGSDYFPENFSFPKNTATLNNLPALKLYDGLSCDCEPAQKIVSLKQRQFDSLKTATDPAEVKKIYDRIRTGIYKEITPKLDQACSPRYNKNLKNNYDSISVKLLQAEGLKEKNAFVYK
ncbi:hypothetical protein [Flavobacterium gilvum]|uniref:Lipoprotein n=1 Tax=Flavobacterium gilvum TaxID=1492737 RepID=A0AAC9N5Z2_9FLAO|nr:hypothetical protein [Flavobacterium gilvum]AOW09852.1 hypothetical protein EM308_10230 [Flavobacterium gilvum]KFC58051.1 hypothetical protein FEM08_31190 [Flavobacterium gilvum]